MQVYKIWTLESMIFDNFPSIVSQSARMPSIKLSMFVSKYALIVIVAYEIVDTVI